jgi:hypothetical protein
MGNICNLCAQEVNEPLTAAGLCPACATSLRPESSNLKAKVSAPPTASSVWQRIKKQQLICGLFSLALSVFFIVMALTGVAEETSSGRTRGSRGFEAMFGKTGTSVVLGLATAGVGFYCVFKSLEDCSPPS